MGTARGKLELDENPQQCVIREIKEETNLEASIVNPLHPYIYKVAEITPVLIIPFLCKVNSFDGISKSAEHKEIGIHDVRTLHKIELPFGYTNTIHSCVGVLM
jgi:8-oxo-dGTP pyrophosphatase MutT (NUDIX family)